MRRYLAIIALLLSGCTMVNEHRLPPADWPELTVTITEKSFWETQEVCDRHPIVAILVGPALGCMWIDFDKKRCDIYLWLNSVLEHELLHCKGYDHYGASTLADGWENWKRENLK